MKLNKLLANKCGLKSKKKAIYTKDLLLLTWIYQ